MTYLSSNQLKQYQDQGYISPIEDLSSSQDKKARKDIIFATPLSWNLIE